MFSAEISLKALQRYPALLLRSCRYSMPRTGLRSYQTSGPTATPTSLLQALQHKAKSYTASKEELNQDQIQELRSLSGQVPLEELGFSEELVQDPWLITPKLTAAMAGSPKKHPFLKGLVAYQEVYESSDMTLGIFMLPAKACIPLHNHPDMVVISRLLFGSMRIKAYDILGGNPGGEALHPARSGSWSSQGEEEEGTGKKSGWPWPFGVGQQQDRCIGQLKLDTVLSASSQEPIVLYPNSRGCTYFREVRSLSPDAASKELAAYGQVPSSPPPLLVELKEYNPGFQCELAPYMGRKLMD